MNDISSMRRLPVHKSLVTATSQLDLFIQCLIKQGIRNLFQNYYQQPILLVFLHEGFTCVMILISSYEQARFHLGDLKPSFQTCHSKLSFQTTKKIVFWHV